MCVCVSVCVCWGDMAVREGRLVGGVCVCVHVMVCSGVWYSVVCVFVVCMTYVAWYVCRRVWHEVGS